MGQPTKIRKRAKQLKGRPVCITLHDGRSYVGYLTGVEKEVLILSRPHTSKASAKNSSTRSRKAEVSAFMPLLGSFFGGSGAGAAGGGLAAGFSGGLRFLGMMQKAMPVMKMGYNMIKTIRPFFNGLKGLMGQQP